MNDKNKDQSCRGITCKSHSARSERADLYRVCPSKLSKRELEDLYYALLENNLDLKRTINGQKEKIKVLSTKVHRITAVQKNITGKDQICCANTKAVICEQNDSIADLKRANERMAERIRLLNMRLCSAKQFLRCTPTQSTSRCMNRSVTAVPTTSSLKNCSMTAINMKGSDLNLKSVGVSCNDEKDVSTRTVETETSEQEKEDPNKPCDQNRCQTVMEELKQKIVNLQEELSSSRSAHDTRIASLEQAVSVARREHAAAAAGLRARDQRAEDLAAMLRGAEAHYSELALALTLERKRVAELEMRLRAESMSCQVVKTIQEHLSIMNVIKKETENDSSPVPQRSVSRLNVETSKESTPPGRSFSPINTPEWDASTPRSDVPTTSRRMSGNMTKITMPNEENKTIKCSDDSGFVDFNKTQESNGEKASQNKVNQALISRIVMLQNQLDALKDTAVDKSNGRQIKLNNKPNNVKESEVKRNEEIPEEVDDANSPSQNIKLYHDSSDTVVREYDAQKNIKRVSISNDSGRDNEEDEKSTDRQIKFYNESSDTVVKEYDAQKTAEQPSASNDAKRNVVVEDSSKYACYDEKLNDDRSKSYIDYSETIVKPYAGNSTDIKKNVSVDISYMDDYKEMDDIDSNKYSSHTSAQRSDKNLTFDDISDEDNVDKKKVAAMKNSQYHAAPSTSKDTNVGEVTETITRRNLYSESTILRNNKEETPSKKDDYHNRYQIPGPIPPAENKNEKKSLRQILVEGISRRKSTDTKISKDVLNAVSTVARNSITLQIGHSGADDTNPTSNTEITSKKPDTKKSIMSETDPVKRPKEKSLSFEDDEQKDFEKALREVALRASTSVQDHRDSLDINRRKLTTEREVIKYTEDKTKVLNTTGEISMMSLYPKAIEKNTSRNGPSTVADGQNQLVTPGAMQFVVNKEDPQFDEQSQIIPTAANQNETKEENQIDICESRTTLCRCRASRRDVAVFRTCSGTLRFRTTAVGHTKFRRCICQTNKTVGPECGIQTDQPEAPPEQRVHRVSLSTARKYTYDPNEYKCTRATSPENTDNEISSLADLPTDRDGKSPRGALSPGEDKATTTFSESCTTPTPTTTDYGSLSEGELPGFKRNQLSKLPSKEKENITTVPSIMSSQKMEAALHAISEELARCRQLLMSQEQTKTSKDESTSVEPTNERLALRKTQATPRIGDTVVPKCVFTLHIGTVVLSDEAVLKSRDLSLVLTWKFFEQSAAMTRLRAGRVVLFDFSTEYDIPLTEEFLHYLQCEEMPIIICEIDKQDEPFASCALPLRDALIHTNRRADMSLALVAGPQMRRASGAADALDAGDELGVLDLWCLLRADSTLLPAGNPAIRVAEDEPSDEYRLSQDLDMNQQRAVHAATDGTSIPQPNVDQTVPSKDYGIQPTPQNIPLNNQINMGRRSSTGQRRSSLTRQKSTHSSELKEKGPVGFQNNKWPPPNAVTTSGLLVNEIPTNIKSTDEMKRALQRNVHDKEQPTVSRLPKIDDEMFQAPSSSSLKSAKRLMQRMKWSDDKKQLDGYVYQSTTNLTKKEPRSNSKDIQGRYLKEDTSEDFLTKKCDISNKSPKSVTIVPKAERQHSINEVPQRERANANETDNIEHDESEQDDVSGTQSLTVTILWLALNEECEAMANPKVQRLYVAYTFLGRSGAELETPCSLPKPKHYVDKCYFNFSKTFQLHDCDLPLVGHMARCRSSNRVSGDPRDCIVFTVISEPPEDPLGLDSCEDIGYAQLYLGDVVAYSGGGSGYTEVVPVRARGSGSGPRGPGNVVGVLAVRVAGLQVVRRCLALSHSHRDLTIYWYVFSPSHTLATS